jgi:uncharacterized protein with PQ loop repeat
LKADRWTFQIAKQVFEYPWVAEVGYAELALKNHQRFLVCLGFYSQSFIISKLVLSSKPCSHCATYSTLKRYVGFLKPINLSQCLCYSEAMHYLGLRHKYERKQGLQKQHKSHYIVFLDRLTLIVGVIGPFTVLPQIYSIFTTKSAAGVSLTTWALIFIVTFPWILYGIAHKEKNIIASFILWEVVNLAVVVGVLLYG